MSMLNKFCKILLLPLCCLFTMISQAQSPQFLVYYVQGNVTRAADQKQIQLKKGDKLLNGDVVNIATASQLVLIYKNYNSIKLDRPGRVKLANIAKQNTQAKPSFITAYLHFVWNELFEGKPDAEQQLQNIGAVSRGRGEKLPVRLDTINYLDGRLKIKLDNDASPILLRIIDTTLKVVAKANVQSNSIGLDDLAGRLKAPGVYYWSLSAYKVRQPGYYLKLWDKPSYQCTINALLQNVIKTTPAETAYMQGFVMERYFFLAEAAKYYKLAIKLNPGNKQYHLANERFL